MKYCNGQAYSDLRRSELEPIVNYCEHIKQKEEKSYSTEKAFIDLCKLYDEVKEYMVANGADIEDLSMITFDVLFSGIKDGFDADKIGSLLMLSKIASKKEFDMITKKDFCKVIDDLKHNAEYLDDIRDVFKKHKRENQVYSTGLENTVISLLETIFKDKENGWVDYWIWELDFGERYEEGSVTEKDGTIIPLKTAEELYDFLIKEMS